MKKILILKSDKDDFEQFYIKKMQSNHIWTVPLYRFKNGLGWIVQVLWMEKLQLPFEQIWYGNWWRKIGDFDVVIIFDRNLSWKIIEKIKEKNPHIRVIIWYWNIITEKNLISNSKNYEIWSFDEGDCLKYKFEFNTQFYFPDIELGVINYEQDVLFVGKDKGRKRVIKEIEEKLNKLGIKVNIQIMSDKKTHSSQYYDKPVEYTVLLKMIQQSKVILDVIQKGQQGMTARVLESIFLRKKLISTSVDLDYREYYDSENMYIWGKDKRSLNEFIHTPYKVNLKNESLREEYSFLNWISRFD